MPQKKKDWTGQKYNRLTFVKATNKALAGGVIWELLCDCGNTTYARGAVVASGAIASCGCSRKEISNTGMGHEQTELPTEVIDKFWIGVDKTNYCWNWKGSIGTHGSPTIRLFKPWKEYSARRVSLQIAGKNVSRSDRVQPLICKNNLCVNPDHLVSGDEERFWSKVYKLNEDNGGCWVWIGSHDKDMYGEFGVHEDGKINRYRAHQYSWLLFAGREVPKRLMLCHTCDHPYCVNPQHLFLGTAKDNALDMMQKERGRSQLTTAVVVEIRQLAQAGILHKNIATKFGVSASTITAVVNRQRWGHVP